MPLPLGPRLSRSALLERDTALQAVGGGRCRTDVQVSASQSLAAGAPAPPTNHVPDINVGKEQSLLSCRFSHLLLRLLLPNTDTESDISKKSRCTLLTCPK